MDDVDVVRSARCKRVNDDDDDDDDFGNGGGLLVDWTLHQKKRENEISNRVDVNI